MRAIKSSRMLSEVPTGEGELRPLPAPPLSVLMKYQIGLRLCNLSIFTVVALLSALLIRSESFALTLRGAACSGTAMRTVPVMCPI